MEQHLLGKADLDTSRLEVLEGPTGRRDWPDDVKGRIVAETLKPGARVVDVAHRHGMAAQHLSKWRRLAREGKIVVPGDDLEVGPMFASVEIAPEKALVPDGGFVAIDFGEVAVRLPSDTPARRIADIAHALRETR
jgi:transposase